MKTSYSIKVIVFTIIVFVIIAISGYLGVIKHYLGPSNSGGTTNIILPVNAVHVGIMWNGSSLRHEYYVPSSNTCYVVEPGVDFPSTIVINNCNYQGTLD